MKNCGKIEWVLGHADCRGDHWSLVGQHAVRTTTKPNKRAIKYRPYGFGDMLFVHMSAIRRGDILSPVGQHVVRTNIKPQQESLILNPNQQQSTCRKSFACTVSIKRSNYIWNIRRCNFAKTNIN